MSSGPPADRSARTHRAAIAATVEQPVPDVLARGLGVVFCGINPGKRSALAGYHFAGPGNRFWPSLYASGFTDRLLTASESGLLPQFGCGITNLVMRATARADQLSAAEIAAGRVVLEAKIVRYKPQWLAVLGVGAYRSAFADRRAAPGRQDRTIGETRVWLLPNTSGLNAHCRPEDFVRHFVALRQAVRATSY